MDRRTRILERCVLLWWSVQLVASQIELGCDYVYVQGSLEAPIAGTYEVLPATVLCSGRQVYRRQHTSGTGSEYYLFYFDNEIEQLASNPYFYNQHEEIPDYDYYDYNANGTSQFEALLSKLHIGSESEESSDSSEESSESSSEAERKHNALEQHLRETLLSMQREKGHRAKRQSDPGRAAPWQHTMPGWMVGPSSCFPYNAPVMAIGRSETPADPTLQWMEYTEHAWSLNQDFYITCTNSATRVSSSHEFAGRQMIGFMLGLSVFFMCVLHALWKRYKRRAALSQDFELALAASHRERTAASSPSAAGHVARSPRNHIVILTFPHAGPDGLRSPIGRARRDELLAGGSDEELGEVDRQLEPEEVAERERILQGDIVAPPAYDELSASTPAPGETQQLPPPTYEEATCSHNAPIDNEHNVPNHNLHSIGPKSES